jgi:predicted RNA-binding protein with PIN domain
MRPHATTRLRRRTVVDVPEWIVDGNNVMGARPDGWWRDRRAAQRRLVSRLEAFAAARDEPVTVIFDGAEHAAGGGIRVAVHFARRGGRDAADDDVAALVARHPEPSSLVVATSDAALADRVRAAGARVVGAGAFLRELERLDHR